MAQERNPAAFLAAEHVAPLWVDPSILTRSQMFERVQELITAAGWPLFLEMRGDADQEDTAEFLGTFEFHSSDDHQEFRYVHRGVEHSCSIAELRDIFGWIGDGEVFTPYGNRESMFTSWRELIQGDTPFVPSSSPAKLLADPAFFYLHFALGRTLLARGNGQHLISRSELGILHLIRQGMVVHWAHYWCAHLKKLKSDAQVHVGGMVTMFLRRRHPSPVPAWHRILEGRLMDEGRFKVASLISVSRSGRICWVYHPNPAYRQAASPTRRGRRSSASSSRARQQQQQMPVAPDQQELFVAFNATRAFIRPGLQPAMPPPDWRPGDAIPPEYR